MLFLWQNSDRIERAGHFFHTLSFFNLHFESYSFHINRIQANVNKHLQSVIGFQTNGMIRKSLAWFVLSTGRILALFSNWWNPFKMLDGDCLKYSFLTKQTERTKSWCMGSFFYFDQTVSGMQRKKHPVPLNEPRMGMSNLWYTSRPG